MKLSAKLFIQCTCIFEILCIDIIDDMKFCTFFSVYLLKSYILIQW